MHGSSLVLNGGRQSMSPSSALNGISSTVSQGERLRDHRIEKMSRIRRSVSQGRARMPAPASPKVVMPFSPKSGSSREQTPQPRTPQTALPSVVRLSCRLSCPSSGAPSFFPPLNLSVGSISFLPKIINTSLTRKSGRKKFARQARTQSAGLSGSVGEECRERRSWLLVVNRPAARRKIIGWKWLDSLGGSEHLHLMI